MTEVEETCQALQAERDQQIMKRTEEQSEYLEKLQLKLDESEKTSVAVGRSTLKSSTAEGDVDAAFEKVAGAMTGGAAG